MAKAEEQSEHAEAYRLVNQKRDTELEFDEWQAAQDKLSEAVEEFDEFEPDDFRIEPITVTDGRTDTDETQEDSDAPAVVDKTEFDPEDAGHQQTEESIVDAHNTAEKHAAVKTAHEQNLKQAEKLADYPEITPVEEKARSIINQLDHADMTRLVWDPDAAGNTVPYDPQKLPYDTVEPSAEAFDMFAAIIEGQTDVTYSVAQWDFTITDETFECTVVIEKKTGESTKQLVGVKTRDTKHYDHWRERLYSKARRNALKQDIPPTWLSTLLRRYKAMNHAEESL